MVVIQGAGDSVTWDEVGHLAAGLSHLRTGSFDLYCVNPPLVRTVAAVPVALLGATEQWGGFATSGHPVGVERPEFYYGALFYAENAARYQMLLTAARSACLPFYLLGGAICLIWARHLYGRAAGMAALLLWSFCPNVMAHGHLITPDCGAAATGLLAGYCFWLWLKRCTLPTALLTGLALGLALLVKFTWLIAFMLWPMMALVDFGRKEQIAKRWQRRGTGLVLILGVALTVFNAGYGFSKFGRRLGDLDFRSQALTINAEGGEEAPSNRFKSGWLRGFPVPLPADALIGIDIQKAEFENKMWSYLCAEWRLGGWWYYYLYALAVKTPLGTLVLGLMAIMVTVSDLRRSHRSPVVIANEVRYSANLNDEFAVLAPGVAIVVFVSFQTGFNHHLRYVLPALPFGFVWISKLAQSIDFRHWKTAAASVSLLAYSLYSSLSVFPHSLSYFNEFVGGPTAGHYHLLNSNIDWGQDLFYLKAWYDAHPLARPLVLAYDLPLIEPRQIGIDYVPMPKLRPSNVESGPTAIAPSPGWYAISVNLLHSRSHDYDYLAALEPIAMAGYSIRIYHVPERPPADQ